MLITFKLRIGNFKSPLREGYKKKHFFHPHFVDKGFTHLCMVCMVLHQHTVDNEGNSRERSVAVGIFNGTSTALQWRLNGTSMDL